MAFNIWVAFIFADLYNGLQLCYVILMSFFCENVILMSKYVETCYMYLTFRILIVAQTMFQAYDSSNIHSINICEVHILCQ
jgi:hypothetical protein